MILTDDGSLNYFIDGDINSLKIKVDTYKRFCENNSIKVKKRKVISITRSILSFWNFFDCIIKKLVIELVSES